MKKILRVVIGAASLIILAVLIRIKLPVFLYNYAYNNYEAGNYTEAINGLRRCIALEPKNASYHLSLGNAFAANKEKKKAMDEFQAAINLDRTLISAYINLAQLYSHRSSFNEALGLIKQALTIDPSNKELKNMLSRVSYNYIAELLDEATGLFASGDKAKAYRLVVRATEIDPASAFANYTLGFFYFFDKDYVSAGVYLENAVKSDSQFWPAYKLLGDIDFENGRYIEAIATYEKIIPQNYDDPQLYNDLGISLMRMEKYGKALVYLKRAMELDPGNLEIRYSLASTFRDNGQFDEALSEYRRVIERQPDYPGVHNDIGDIYENLRRLEDAQAEYKIEISYAQEKLARHPDNPVLLNNLAYALNKAGQTEDALEVINRAIESQPDYRQAYLTAAGIYKKIGNLGKAAEFLAKAGNVGSGQVFTSRDINKIKRQLNRVDKPATDGSE